MDPDFLNINQKRDINLWPDTSLVSRCVIPYINRMKQETVTVTIVGDDRGESTYDILKECPKVSRVAVVDYEYDSRFKELREQNVASVREKISYDTIGQTEVVCVVGKACTFDNLNKFYSFVKSGGIFAGSNHDYPQIKEALNKFRRHVKIGTPIQIAHRTNWFWNKR